MHGFLSYSYFYCLAGRFLNYWFWQWQPCLTEMYCLECHNGDTHSSYSSVRPCVSLAESASLIIKLLSQWEHWAPGSLACPPACVCHKLRVNITHACQLRRGATHCFSPALSSRHYFSWIFGSSVVLTVLSNDKSEPLRSDFTDQTFRPKISFL